MSSYESKKGKGHSNVFTLPRKERNEGGTSVDGSDDSNDSGYLITDGPTENSKRDEPNGALNVFGQVIGLVAVIAGVIIFAALLIGLMFMSVDFLWEQARDFG